MTKKKELIKKAKTIRKLIKGVDLPLSKKLAKVADVRMDFLDKLRQAGFEIDTIVDYYCSDDGDPIGRYVIKKKGQVVGEIPYTCCGIELKEG